MPPIDPRLVLAKRFPLHAAVDQCYMPQIKKLCEEDAEFHVVRKVQNYETSVIHQVCTLRGIQNISEDILRYLIKKGAPINEPDSIGQRPLHYATSNPDLSKILLPILISEGAQVNVQRQNDGWTPLHLAAMFGRSDLVGILLKNGADPDIQDKDGNKPEEIARKHRFHALADLLNSPRKDHCPGKPSIETTEADFIQLLGLTTKDELQKIKMKEKYTTWRNEEKNSLLHLAAWDGNLELCRWFFDSPRGRKLTAEQNMKGASPLALSIINGQTQVVEEFFMNKHSKSNIILDSKLSTSGENIVHLLIQYLPNVHSKFVLKRKDLTADILNAKENLKGNSPALYCAMRNNKVSLKRILSSKAVKEQQLLDLSLRNKEGQTLLHLLAENKDESNFRIIMNDHSTSLTSEIANMENKEGDTCLIISLLRGSPLMVRDILQHPTASNKFNLAYNKGGLSPLHLVAEQGNISLWNIAVSHPSCDLNARDPDGNTPLMTAAIKGNSKMLESWFRSIKTIDSVDLSASNKNGDTILSLFMKNIHDKNSLISFISSVNLKSILNQPNLSSEYPLTIALQKENWDVVTVLLSHANLRNKVGDDEETEGVLDVHVTVPQSGHSALASVLTAHVKLNRQVQTHNMKKQRVLAEECKKKCEALWELVQKILLREKEMHGPTMIQGRDGGSACIKKQMEAGKLIRAPDQDEVVAQYTKHYQFVKKRKPTTAPPLETKKPAEKERPKPVSQTQNGKEEALPSPKVEDSSLNNVSNSATSKPKETKTKKPKAKQVNGNDAKEKISGNGIGESPVPNEKNAKLAPMDVKIDKVVNNNDNSKKGIEKVNNDLLEMKPVKKECHSETKANIGSDCKEKIVPDIKSSIQCSPDQKKESKVENNLSISNLVSNESVDDKFVEFLKSKTKIFNNGESPPKIDKGKDIINSNIEAKPTTPPRSKQKVAKDASTQTDSIQKICKCRCTCGASL